VAIEMQVGAVPAAQHCMPVPHTPAEPHFTPSGPLHVPFAQVCDGGHGWVVSHLNDVES
jgi:hypothetical protein